MTVEVPNAAPSVVPIVQLAATMPFASETFAAGFTEPPPSFLQ